MSVKCIIIWLQIYYWVLINAKYKPNPEWSMSSLEVIKYHGYPAMSFTIASSDGFLLTLHRIPNSGQPVYLHHGIFHSSMCWLSNGAKSLPFLLSDAGYDVWLGNSRGNVYSMGHVKYTPMDKAFWNHSWHEMGVIDLPVAFRFIEDKTDTKGEIIYIGHSMGTTIFFVYASMFPDSAETVKMMAALSPAAYMAGSGGIIKFFASWNKVITWFGDTFGWYDLLPKKVMLKITEMSCEVNEWQLEICKALLFLSSRFNKEQFDQQNVPLIVKNLFSGTSLKTIAHYLQEANSPDGNFKQYDYGPVDNMKHYGSTVPPSYNVSNIQIPVVLMAGSNDVVVGLSDVEKLSRKLPKVIKYYMNEYGHLDFLYGKNVVEYIYQPLLNLMKNYTT